MLNLFVAIFWLFVAVGLLYAYLTGRQVFRVSESGVEMLALLALLLAAYNLVRWWAMRASVRARARQLQPEQRRRRSEGSSDEYDPTFDFTGREPPEPPQKA